MVVNEMFKDKINKLYIYIYCIYLNVFIIFPHALNINKANLGDYYCQRSKPTFSLNVSHRFSGDFLSAVYDSTPASVTIIK